MSKRTIDLNADVGEASDAEGRERERALLALVTTAHVACGYHAGDAETSEAAFAALVVATVAAFFVTQHLKVTTPLIAGAPSPLPAWN